MDRYHFNPLIHHRRSIRLHGYDYSSAGLYFVTICCYKHLHLFGHLPEPTTSIGAGASPAPTALTGFGIIASNEWLDLPNRFTYIELGEFVIMPNHMHGIICIKPHPNNITVGAGLAPALTDNTGDEKEPNPGLELGNIVGSYKSLVANKCLELHISTSSGAGTSPAPTMGKIWQRNYFEHIIRNQDEYERIAAYIINNPANWKNDKFYR